MQKKYYWLTFLGGLIIGGLALLLSKYGNPANMGVCVACFLRDFTGALGLHANAKTQYLRPEILGFVLGSFLLAKTNREFNPVGGSAPVIRLLLGIIAMWGMLVFLGCPLRAAIRLGAGDFNAIPGILGLIAGVWTGTLFIRQNFTLGRATKVPRTQGYAFPLLFLALTVLVLTFPTLFLASKEGPGASHAPVLISLIAGLAIGGLAQKFRLCMVGGIRDFILFKNYRLLLSFAGVVLSVFAGSLYLGTFKPGFTNQPLAHTETLWNFLGLYVAGWAAVLLGGCPLRQLILTGEGNTDAAITVVGLMLGAALAHNFGIAASPKGVTAAGVTGIIIALAVLLTVSIAFSEKLRTVFGFSKSSTKTA
ncbi:membrane protein [Carboxydothermus islandicus]|uniref:Membrane protein n=1 Tax=Carboxydothermus islandicus TaxID=661089 RepID=A0A1L8D2Z0_9THEO|nr:YedE family putative selenium transporter [Carboxydothermus islandicus]GAV25529.1 membrane protein [Carboxydothermus islandicus]